MRYLAPTTYYPLSTIYQMPTEKQLLRLILGLFILLGITYALVTPPFEASDELWHYPMIQHLGNGNPLPVQVYDPAEAGPWKQEASQPPLYYYLGAGLTFWIDTSDMDTVRWLNPHVDNGVITADGNTNLAIHPDHFSNWQGSLLAIRLVRLASVLLGACTVYLTYLIGKEVAPQRPELALGAAAINAFTPMFLFISGAVNNDNLAIPLASLGVLLLIRLVTRPPQNTKSAAQQTLLFGMVTGLAILTKQGTFALLPLAGGTFVIYQWVHGREQWQNALPFGAQLRDLGQILLRASAQFALMLLPVVLIAGWWYWRNIQLYGDFLGWSAFIAVLGQRETAAPLAQLWQERWGFMLSYWGLFGGVNIPMWTWVYYGLNGLVLLAVPGFVVYLVLLGRDWWRDHGRVILATPANWLQKTIILLLDFVRDNFGLVVTALFSFGVVYGLIQWATTTWSSQGRLVFTAISTLNVLFVLGLAGWMPRRWARLALGGVSGFLLVLAALAPWLFIRPAYLPPALASGETCTAVVCLDESATFSDHLRLLGYDL
ncbi:MAG: glycosyltransferase family 39 protein, partial [Anaerolineales bacterium]|nr:glycosyltransferase family 39 protein [Anaerolineales bacterium]